MPDCGRCLNVGRAGKRARHQNPTQFNLDNGVLLGLSQPTPNGATCDWGEVRAPGRHIDRLFQDGI